MVSRHLLLLAATLLLTACNRGGAVAVGLGVADVAAEPALREYAARQDARVDSVRGAAGVDPTQVDLLWDRDLDAILALAAKGQLAPLAPDDAGRVTSMVGSGRTWIGISAVARVLVYDPERLADATAPTHFVQLAQPELARQTVLAYPARGRATWTVAALADRLGEPRALELYRAALGGGARVVADEDAVLAALVAGEAALALTDSDLAFAAQERLPRLVISIPDQEPDGLGALLLPIALAMTKRGADNAAARGLADYLLSLPVTLNLTITANQILVLHDNNAPAGTLRADDLRLMPVAYAALAERLPALRQALARR